MMQEPIPPPWQVLSVPVCLDCPKPIDPTSKLWTSRVHLDHSLGKVTQTQYQHRHLWLTACHTPMTWGGKRPNLSQVYWSRDSYALALGKYVQKGREGWGILFIPFFLKLYINSKNIQPPTQLLVGSRLVNLSADFCYALPGRRHSVKHRLYP